MAFTLMSGFPAIEADQVTLANWRSSPYKKWAFQHVRELVPSADIANPPSDVWRLESEPWDFSSFRLEHGGKAYGVDSFLDATDTDGLVVLRRGKVVLERYGNGMTADTPHILMSVSKSLTAMIASILVAQGKLDAEQGVVTIIPQLRGSVYAGATVRHLLDMRVGLAFDEDYLATSGPIIEYRKAANWNPLDPGESPGDLRTFLARLVDRNLPDGGPFHYVSTNTDLLGWILERVSGIRFADLMSTLLWQPMGAQCHAYITVDRLGAPRCAGGICTTTMDLARVGQLIVRGGRRDTTPIIPVDWIEDLFDGGDPKAWAAGDLASYFGDRAIHYRSQWYVLREKGIILGLGVYGQNLFVDQANGIVIAKVSSQKPPLDAGLINLTLEFAEQMIEHVK